MPSVYNKYQPFKMSLRGLDPKSPDKEKLGKLRSISKEATTLNGYNVPPRIRMKNYSRKRVRHQKNMRKVLEKDIFQK